MEDLWFCLVATMFALYVVFDGFDIGAGIIHLWVARTEEERRLVLRTIGPVWDGNEVWLIAGGGTLYFAFPAVYASAFSGFYLPLMIVLWLLILRGVAIEFRNHLESPIWNPLWDVVFSVSSLLLALFFAAALGNVVRGVSLSAEGTFFSPLWTDFRPGPETGVLDWFTIPVGLAGVVALALHGALWIATKTEGEMQQRSRHLARGALWLTAILSALATLLSFAVQDRILLNLSGRPWGYLFPAMAVSGLGGAWWFLTKTEDAKAFLASSLFLIGMLASAAFGIYPHLLPSVSDAALGLGVGNAAASAFGLRVGLVWWTIGMTMVVGYFVFTYRHFAGKVNLKNEGY
ncbi:MAG: cytochrome d ubiquinol oxidase subunit II [Vicinamibacteria bacterium]